MKKKLSEQYSVGIVFEGVAEKVLREKGYKILERNYKFGKYEIDLIAKKKDEIAFVEVKSLKSNDMRRPEQAVTAKKMRNVFFAACGYIKLLSYRKINPRKYNYSFDVVAITTSEQHDILSIEYFKDYYLGDRDEILRFAL